MRSVVLLALWGVVIAGCYQQPAIPLDKPLACSAADPNCPLGYSCIGARICAPKACAMTTDCPTGLVCTPGRGCGLKPEGEGGASDSGTKDGGATADASGDVSASNTDALGSD